MGYLPILSLTPTTFYEPSLASPQLPRGTLDWTRVTSDPSWATQSLPALRIGQEHQFASGADLIGSSSVAPSSRPRDRGAARARLWSVQGTQPTWREAADEPGALCPGPSRALTASRSCVPRNPSDPHQKVCSSGCWLRLAPASTYQARHSEPPSASARHPRTLRTFVPGPAPR